MITKWYEVTCDYCGGGINHYIGKKPSRELMESDGAITTSTKQFCCDACYADYKHDLDEKRYLNINPSGRIHHDETTVIGEIDYGKK